MGKILRVDLSTQAVKTEELRPEIARMFLGGSGLCAYYLYQLTGPETSPLGPENPLVFMTGPLTGTKVPLSGRHEVAMRSPLTGIYGEADVGGKWGTEFKKTGYDGVIVTNKAPKPVYLWIHDRSIDFRDAGHVWGKTTYETDEILRKETDIKALTQCIGPAGEQLAPIAAILTDGHDGRALARCGPGAVMGSKNLKAMVAKGELPVPLHDEDALTRLIREMGPKIVKDTKSLHNFGTSGGTVTIEQIGDLPVKNWLEGSFTEGAQKISGQKMAESILTGYYYCGACIVGCGRVVAVSQGKYAPVRGAGPEYETVATLGAQALIDDLEAIAKAHELSNLYGMDVISVGTIVGFAIEAYERGLIGPQDTDGLKLTWGNADAMVELVHRIGRREGIGRLLGEGVRRAAQALGGMAAEFAMETKGLEFPAHDPRAYNSVGLGYATSNRGACHLQGGTHWFERNVTMPDLGYPEIQDRFAVDGKGEFVAKMQNLMALFDSAKLCKFILFGGVKATHLLNWINYVTGFNWDLPTMMQTGERIFNLKRLYNVRLGVSRKDDTLPPRILTHRRGTGGAANNLPPLGTLLNQYYQYRGWDEMGRPTPQKLQELELDALAGTVTTPPLASHPM